MAAVRCNLPGFLEERALGHADRSTHMDVPDSESCSWGSSGAREEGAREGGEAAGQHVAALSDERLAVQLTVLNFCTAQISP